jgi:hypothetical protein
LHRPSPGRHKLPAGKGDRGGRSSGRHHRPGRLDAPPLGRVAEEDGAPSAVANSSTQCAATGEGGRGQHFGCCRLHEMLYVPPPAGGPSPQRVRRARRRRRYRGGERPHVPTARRHRRSRGGAARPAAPRWPPLLTTRRERVAQRRWGSSLLTVNSCIKVRL